MLDPELYNREFTWNLSASKESHLTECQIAQIFLDGFHEKIPGGSLYDWVLQYGSCNTHANETILKELHYKALFSFNAVFNNLGQNT